MRSQLTKLREKRENGDHGFTLIELLVVVVIIGILVAIAIPVYLNFRKGAENRSAQSDTRNAVTTIEQCFNDGAQNYPASFGTLADNAYPITCGTSPQGTGSVRQTVGNTMTYTYVTATKSYKVKTTNTDTGKSYEYDSSTGKVTES